MNNYPYGWKREAIEYYVLHKDAGEDTKHWPPTIAFKLTLLEVNNIHLLSRIKQMFMKTITVASAGRCYQVY